MNNKYKRQRIVKFRINKTKLNNYKKQYLKEFCTKDGIF